MHQGLSIAATAVSMDRKTNIFFFWWALERLGKGEIDEPVFPSGYEGYESRFESKGFPTLRHLLEILRASGLCTLHACTASMTLIQPPMEGIEQWLDGYVGWSSILQLTAGVTDRFYL
jgi:peroxiredoxin family protein